MKELFIKMPLNIMFLSRTIKEDDMNLVSKCCRCFMGYVTKIIGINEVKHGRE
jgi:hypothetical protein